MNESNAYGFEDDSQLVPKSEPLPPPGAGQTFPASYKFTPDELKVLGECNRESFFQRSLPLGTAMGTAAYIALQKGYLKQNPKFGVFPKVTLAVVMGYFIGKISYQGVCAEKLMALPGSYIGQLLRERKEGKVYGTAMQKQPPTMFGANPNDIYSDAGPGSSLNLDTDRPLFNDDTYRPDTAGPVGQPPEKSALTYEELRRRNRTEYSESKQDPYKVDPGMMPPISRQPPPPQSPPKKTNKYGDFME